MMVSVDKSLLESSRTLFESNYFSDHFRTLQIRNLRQDLKFLTVALNRGFCITFLLQLPNSLENGFFHRN
jgi:hypothetical protein